MERRAFMGAGAAVLAGAGLAACGGGGGSSDGANGDSHPPSGSKSAGPSGPPAPSVSAPADLAALGKGLDGSLVRPGDDDWTSAGQLYNTRFDGLRPAAVAYVAGVDDIRTALAYARARKTHVAIRNGGHSYAGWSSGDGRLVVDVSRLSSIRVSGSEAVVGAGAKLIDVYRALTAKGVTIPAGSCPTVGVSGLTLGGGHGVASRAYGLTCDNLTAATVVTADGRQLHADAKENSDLFWALRGGGNGNFGVVTELRFRTHPAPQGVTAYMSWPWSRAADVVAAWQEWGPDQPDEIWSALDIENAAGGVPGITVSAFSLGTYGELQNAVDRLADRAGGPASSVSLKRRSYEDSMEVYAGCSTYSGEQCHLPGPTAGRSEGGALKRETYAARSDFFDRSLSKDGIQTLLDHLASVDSGTGSVALTALGGAVNRVAPTATAFVHRRSRMLAQYVASWQAGTSGTAAGDWLDRTHGAMRPHASGAAYQNYTDPTLKDWRPAYYGDAASRLEQVKHRYDPDGFFTYPQGI
ncbi:FAD-binding oxidoreductase [Streptomyces sp. NPDC050560]|uniref:FAD-binding oxidoreductase n=1 Tax=Streptomyces sp. NPDC050560 TaxID=3365630 RepID=UPI00379645CC